MEKSGPAFYDDDVVFATYMQRRQRVDTPNDTLEKPVILELVGEIAGKSVLDLGCGDAAIGREFLQHGASAYLGIDGSANMAALAMQALAGTSGQVVHHAIEDWQYPMATFDLVLARLVLHYVADLPALCAKIQQSLLPDGRFVFSVEASRDYIERSWLGKGRSTPGLAGGQLL